MASEPVTEKLLNDFREIRDELDLEVRRFTPGEFTWEPRPGMKSCKELVQEIGVTEIECAQWMRGGSVEKWDDIWESLRPMLTDPESSLAALTEIRRGTVELIGKMTNEALHTSRPTPQAWHVWRTGIEPAELLRWLARHEYYHLGQIITYRWLLGDNPYKRE